MESKNGRVGTVLSRRCTEVNEHEAAPKAEETEFEQEGRLLNEEVPSWLGRLPYKRCSKA
jgi:hypothetical protein